ncbi:MAG TPA: tetratricopeptide repeat protein [Bryobacteraceae bacterium]|nr:tetratricopeptide repeat protein [Bryobacteraceae bacterium]
MGSLSTVLAGNNFRAGVSVTAVLVVAFVVTGFLSSAYHRAGIARGHRHYEIGQALQRAGNLEGAAEEYRKALLFLPDEPDYRFSLCVALVELGKLDEAQSHLQDLLAVDPTNGLFNLMMARIDERRHKTSQAIDDFQRAVYGYWPRGKLQQRHAARWELVSLLQQQNRPNAVIGELLQLYANAPDDPEEKSKIGFLLLHYGATSDALNLFRELVRDHPRYVEAYHGLGQAQLNSGDYLSARRDFQRAAHLDPSDHDNLKLLALANSVLELDPSLPRLRASARLRRSHSILARVLRDLAACNAANVPQTASVAKPANNAEPAGSVAPSPPSPLQQQLNNAATLLNAKPTDLDQAALDMQDTAGQLWKDRSAFCPGKTPQDRPLELVLSRIAQ